MVRLCGLLNLCRNIDGIAQYGELNSSRVADEAPVDFSCVNAYPDAYRRIKAAFDVPLINVAKQANSA
jgi:hypothetical protein